MKSIQIAKTSRQHIQQIFAFETPNMTFFESLVIALLLPHTTSLFYSVPQYKITRRSTLFFI